MKKYLLFVVIGLVVVLAACGGSKTEDSKQLDKITLAEFQTKLENKDSGFVYIGRPTCPDCQAFQPTLDAVLKDENMRLDYFDTDAARKEKEEQTKQFLQDMKVKTVPVIFYLENGKEVSRYDGNDDEKALAAWFDKYSK
ncbi:thioredoxin family protein [Listeria booriae]|uniref:Thioredoxin family protein n=1 Tax=Listeria booriae TaxID=1552123 RepID=A0A7X0X9U0_9LIST|nr:thioredoxin family protein [Listeria booriae]MBC1490223.1 thioredoxin family protein [Listeria booriae]MBC1502565.1 thioredoxin family protein [Listeria booriae]MBC1523228.1 thioredoxin family protein [Listeria booriae]